MKIRIITALALLSGLLMGSCSREDVPGGGQSGTGNRVEFTLAGITPKHETRATGDNDTAQQIVPATEDEKKVTSLLAVAYEKQESGQMGYYQTFDVSVSDAGCSFDIAKEGRFDLYLVANADRDLEAAIRGLGVGSAVTELEELIATQAPDAAGAFLMTTPEALKIISYSGEVANCGEVSLRRLSARVDIYNKADGLTITKVTFRNRAVKSQLITPNAMISGDDVVEDKEYAMNLEGNFNAPTKYEAQIYTYENLSTRGSATVPSLNIEYTYNGETYEHEVQFLDANDPEELTPLALKRNYLYRITVGRKLEPEFNLEVLDWVNEDAFNVDDIPFQTQMNAKLAINNFATSNVKTLDEGENTVTFVTEDPNHTSEFFAWSDKWSTAVYRNTVDGEYYRVPTKDELYLFFPDAANNIKFDQVMDGTSEIDETLPEKLFGSEEVNGGAGKSVFKNAASVSPTPVGTRAGGPAYPIVYAIRFKGTAQCAAYRYEVKNYGDETNGELEIRIKALQPNTLMTIEEVADESYWGNPADGDTDAGNQLIYHIASTGYKNGMEDPDAKDRGFNSLLWSSTSKDDGSAYDGGHYNVGARVADIAKTSGGTLRLVKATDEESQTMRNAALKVNMFAEYLVKTLDVSQKKVEFFDDLELADQSSYFSWEELNANGILNAELVDVEGNKYRVPTKGELLLLLPDNKHNVLNSTGYPFWNNNESTSLGLSTLQTPFTETLYFENNSDYTMNMSGEKISGLTSLKIADPINETVHYVKAGAEDTGLDGNNYNIRVAYGLRFKGTDQYAAYRWESCKIQDNPLERYFSIKIKAIRNGNTKISIDNIAQESFWTDGYIEIKLPSLGYYSFADKFAVRGVYTYCAGSTIDEKNYSCNVNVSLGSGFISDGDPRHKMPLFLVHIPQL